MNNIKNFDGFLNESANNKKIDIHNVLEYKDKIVASIAMLEDENLRKGLEFVLSNIADYNKDEFVKEISDSFFDNFNKSVAKRLPKFWDFEDRGYTGFKSTGKKYELTKDLTTTEIAKLVRKELSIEFPDWKISVKSDSFSGGSAIRINILDLPYNPYSEEADTAYKNNSYPNASRTHYDYSLYNEQFKKDEKKIKGIMNQYNFDDSDGQIDYFHTNFYGSVSLDDSAMKRKYYPEHNDVKRDDEWARHWAERKAVAKAKADEIKSKFQYKKGDEVIYVYDKESAVIPKGEYPALILKAPNGRSRGMFPKYDIRFTIDKKFLNGELVTLKTPQNYTTTLYGDEKLKEKGV